LANVKSAFALWNLVKEKKPKNTLSEEQEKTERMPTSVTPWDNITFNLVAVLSSLKDAAADIPRVAVTELPVPQKKKRRRQFCYK
jgi:hypothetical protein